MVRSKRAPWLGGLRRRLLGLWLDYCPSLALRIRDLDPCSFGRAAEGYVAEHLAAAGWRILGRRVQAPGAELDIVAWDGDELVAVEVKASRVARMEGLRYRPGERLEAKRLRSQTRAIARLASQRKPPSTSRVDLVELYLVAKNPRPQLIHLRDRRSPLGRHGP